MDSSTSGPVRIGRIRDFRLLWVSGLAAGLGAQMSSIALPLLVLRETGSAVLAGAVGTVSVTALLVSMLPAGALADTVERRRLMRVCDAASLLVVTALAVAILLGEAPLALVVLVACAGAVITTLYGPAALGMLRAIVPQEQLGTASARMQARSATARLIGPTVGGVLFTLHPALPFVGEAVALLVSMICVTLIRTRSAPEPGATSAFDRREFTAGVRFLWSRPYLRTVLLVFGLGMNATFAATMFVAVAAASDGGTSGIGSGTIVSLTAAGSLLGALLAPRLPSGLRPGVLIGATCWMCAVAVGLMTLNQNPVYIGLLCAASIALASMASIGFMTSLLMATPGPMVGRVQSAAGFVSSLVQPLGPVAGGVLLTSVGAPTTYALLGGVFALCAAVVSWAPSVRRQPAPVRADADADADADAAPDTAPTP